MWQNKIRAIIISCCMVSRAHKYCFVQQRMLNVWQTATKNTTNIWDTDMVQNQRKWLNVTKIEFIIFHSQRWWATWIICLFQTNSISCSFVRISLTYIDIYVPINHEKSKTIKFGSTIRFHIFLLCKSQNNL